MKAGQEYMEQNVCTNELDKVNSLVLANTSSSSTDTSPFPH